jgi:hypothetical protein
VAKVTSVFPVHQNSGPEEGDCHPALFFTAGSHFDNLKIDGKPYDFCVDDEKEEEPGKNQQDNKAQKQVENPKQGAKEKSNGFTVRYAESTRASIVPAKNQAIHIEQFGTIYLGEIFKYGGKVILSMFRAELGCPDQGTATGPTACTNGGNGLKRPGH